MEQEIIVSLIKSLESSIVNYGEFAIALGVFLLGENAILAVFAMSATGLIAPHIAIIWAFVGSISADIFWFFITEYILREKYEKRLMEASQEKTNRFFMKMIDDHFLITLIFIKFLVGIRLILTIYIVIKNKIPFSQKILLDTLSNIIFISVLFPVGWLVGKGFPDALSTQQYIVHIISIVTAVTIGGQIISRTASKLIEKYYKEI